MLRLTDLREILRYVPRFRDKVFVIALDGALVEDDNFSNLLLDIALLPAYRRRGIGTVLLAEVLSEGAQSGKVVSIHVEAFNPALEWYERLGFIKVATNGPYHLMERPAGANVPGSAAAREATVQST